MIGLEQITHPQTGEPFWIPRVSNVITDALRRGEAWEPYLDALAPVLGASGRLIIEVGAYCGEHTVVLSQYAPVLAIEPQALPFACLTVNATRRELDHAEEIDPIRTLVGVSGVVTPREDNTNMHPSNGWVRPTDTLRTSNNRRAPRLDTVTRGIVRADSTTSHSVGAIKIDAQGMDLCVLRGAEEIVREYQPIILCEFEPSYAAVWNHGFNDYRAWFDQHDYHPPIVFEGGNWISTHQDEALAPIVEALTAAGVAWQQL